MATQAQLDAVERALYSGVLEVEYEDRKVRYPSIKDLMAVQAQLRRELGLTSAASRKTLASFNKGT